MDQVPLAPARGGLRDVPAEQQQRYPVLQQQPAGPADGQQRHHC